MAGVKPLPPRKQRRPQWGLFSLARGKQRGELGFASKSFGFSPKGAAVNSPGRQARESLSPRWGSDEEFGIGYQGLAALAINYRLVGAKELRFSMEQNLFLGG